MSRCLRDALQFKLVDSSKWKNGNANRMQPRWLHCVDSPILLVSKLYNCENGHREVVACYPVIVKEILDCYVGFIASHKSGVTKNFLFLFEQCLDKGMSFDSIKELHKERYEITY